MRYPVVAGQFYTSDKNMLLAEINDYIKEGGRLARSTDTRDVVAAVVPHAGYMYSGWIAGYTYAAIANAFAKPPAFIIAGPNHTGVGAGIAVSVDEWATPLGNVQADGELAKLIVKKGRSIELDETAHIGEHSIEVQLPFLQAIYREFRFVPICVMMQNAETAEDIGKAVFEAAKELKREVVFIASSDFTHYESAESARKKDETAIERIKQLGYRGFIAAVERGISICGFGPIAAALIYAGLRGAKKAEVLKYGNSGDRSGDYAAVVGYGSIVARA